jgi:hypothetical protein
MKSQENELTVLTNSGRKSAKEALESATLADLFDGVLSSDDVKRLKTAPEPYLMAASVRSVFGVSERIRRKERYKLRHSGSVIETSMIHPVQCPSS